MQNLQPRQSNTEIMKEQMQKILETRMQLYQGLA